MAKFDLLARVEPVRVLIPKDASQEEVYNARRVKGFHELQAELLKKPESKAAIEMGKLDDVNGAVVIGLVSRPEVQKLLRDDRVGLQTQEHDRLVASISGGSALLITSATERGLREALWDYLAHIEAPLPNDALKTEMLAAPVSAQ